MECHRADLGCALEQSVDECGHVIVQPSRLLQIATGSQCVDHSVPEMNLLYTPHLTLGQSAGEPLHGVL